jgi:CRISPR-associated protein Cas2
MRRRYLVTYDVSDAKRLRRTYRVMHGFGEPVQYSVFMCDLSKVERQMMRERLTTLLNLREDRVLIIDLGEVGARNAATLEVIGRQLSPRSADFAAIIV